MLLVGVPVAVMLLYKWEPVDVAVGVAVGVATTVGSIEELDMDLL